MTVQATIRPARDDGRRDTFHRQLRIVVGPLGSSFRAIAYRGARRFMEAEGDDADAAVTTLKGRIDALHRERFDRRMGGDPSPEEFGDALLRIEAAITPVQAAALARHTAGPGACVTFHRLAVALGVDEDAVLENYARLGRLLGDILDFRPSQQVGLGRHVQPVLVVAQPAVGPQSETRWVLRENLCRALDAGPR